MVVDGEPISLNNGMVTLETVPLEMVMLQGHKETIQFDIVHMDNHAYILGMPWLKQHNPHDATREEDLLGLTREKELKVLKEYINDNLAKGFIKPSTLLAGSPVLFVLKKDGSLRLCVDYRALNNITVKDRYALPLINELHDRFQGAKIFTKVTAVLEWPTPTTVKEVQAFLGFANFYRRFIAGYSKVAQPLTELTRKDLVFEWTDKAEAAFQELKTKFTEAPILATFDPAKKIILETDSSDFAIRACLNQPDENGKFKPIAYYSRKLSPAELNYDIHDKELLAIVVAFKQWRVYLEGSTYPVQV
ncbi:hypothetical protein VE02_10362 [Pseudogymnoascus sp. 03VT05]|nr:hypothetical protein VE02_10362 [Pseudogymnoascus sp. 03VT05]